MTMMLTETRERFLLAIVKQVPAEQIAEIHFFQPIKQGGVESGVAVVAAVGLGAESSGEDEIPQPQAPSSQPDPKHVIYTARYRLTLKGLDRGKWESHIVAEADAPLITLDAVVRGVQRRSGDVDEPTRIEGDEVRALVEAKLHA
jgi:hypothetical protein